MFFYKLCLSDTKELKNILTSVNTLEISLGWNIHLVDQVAFGECEKSEEALKV